MNININNVDKTQIDVYYDLTHKVTSYVPKGKKPPKRKNQRLIKVKAKQ